MISPHLTIIIAIRNVAADLKVSLDNFSAQSFTDFEVLIADCNSTDAPAEHFTGRSYPLLHIVQSDSGIYDAWNRVLPQARGTWVMFMGAGDTFKAPDTLKQVAQLLAAQPKGVLIAYGRVDVIGENGQILQQCGAPWCETIVTLGKLGMYPHQATFQRRRSFELCGNFDPRFKIAGDVEMVLRVARQATPVYMDVNVANFQFGGTSSKAVNRLNAAKERRLALAGSSVPRRYHWAFAKAVVLDMLHRILPQQWLHRLIDTYRVMTGRKRRYEIL